MIWKLNVIFKENNNYIMKTSDSFRGKAYKIIIAFVCIVYGLSTGVQAQLQPAGIFSTGLVIQRDLDIPVWGTANAEDTIIVTLNAEDDTAYADGSGKWLANLPAMSAGGPYIMTIESGSDLITLSDVYIGDVWIASGQSNMEMTLSQTDGSSAIISSANNQTIRQFKIPKSLGTEPTEIFPSGSAWTPATSSFVGSFTGVGYYFARDLQEEIGVPIGIINTSYGGSRIETWMSEEMLGYNQDYIVLANGEPERQPARAYNNMIHPLLPARFKGVIWYQGESNGDSMEDAVAYGDLFKRMINGWREIFEMPDLPFLWVQLPNFGEPNIESEPSTWDAWPQVRAGQSRALSLPNTGEAVTIDVGAVDIHPTNKAPVGNRLSLIARKVVYGEDIVYSGPRYKTHIKLADGRVKIKFDHTGSGLADTYTVNDTIRWFSIADSNGNLTSAKAILDGDSVIVWNDAISDPYVIRYAWEYNPLNTNLYNIENLPASPFSFLVNHPGFKIQSFVANDTVIERTKSTVLSWQTHGASPTTLNGVPVDSIEAIMIYPDDTTDYKLKIVNSLDPGEMDSATITINVIDPLPTVVVSTSVGDVVEPDIEITIMAEADAPGGGTVAQVEFFIDGVSIFTDFESPYETTWTPPTSGEYAITAVVTNGDDVSVESEPLNLLVTYLNMLIYEAEDADFTGTGTIINNSAVSGGTYLDLRDGWILTFSGVHVNTAGEYQLNIRYLLNYESPKSQDLIINGTFYESITFTAPNTTTWRTYRVNIPLNAGDNEIVFDGVWEWMSFDYIAIAVAYPISVESFANDNSEFLLEQNYPNPFNSYTDISYVIPKSGHVTLIVYDITGAEVAVLIDEEKTAGKYTRRFDNKMLSKGLYFYKMTFNSDVQIKKMLIVK